MNYGTRMIKGLLAGMLLLLTTMTSQAIAAESADALYKQAYMAETVERDPAKAVELYKKVIQATSDQEPLAAKAHLRLGLSYEKMGRPHDARLSFQDVLDMGADAPAAVAQQARDHLQRSADMAMPAASERESSSPRISEQSARLSQYWEASLQGGAALPIGNEIFGENPGVSGLIQGSILYRVSTWVALGLEIGYSTDHSAIFLDPISSTEYHLSMLQVTPEIEVGPWLGPVKPYLMMGGGLYRSYESLEYSSIYPSFYPAYYTETTNNNGGFNVGLGLLCRVGKNFAMGPDIRYHHVFGENHNFHYIASQVRLALLF